MIRPRWDVLIKQIEAFVEVVRRGTVSRAAEALGITQPALTARLHGLERALGQAVFARSGRGVRLTDAGRVFLPHAERALLAIGDGQTAVADLVGGRAGKLVIGATGSVCSYVLPKVLKRFRLEHPRIDLTVRTGHSEQVMELVLAEAVELAIVRELRHDDLDVIPLYDDELALVTHPSHPFAQRGSTRLVDVVAEGLVVFDRASSYYELTQALFVGAGVPPRTIMELDNFEAAKKMLEEGLGVALLPKVAVARELELGQLAPSRSSTPDRYIAAWSLFDGMMSGRLADRPGVPGPAAGDGRREGARWECERHGCRGALAAAPPSRIAPQGYNARRGSGPAQLPGRVPES